MTKPLDGELAADDATAASGPPRAPRELLAETASACEVELEWLDVSAAEAPNTGKVTVDRMDGITIEELRPYDDAVLQYYPTYRFSAIGSPIVGMPPAAHVSEGKPLDGLFLARAAADRWAGVPCYR